ncbi:MAG: Crp/Fnr family transcriptional regulator [Bacteroidetes bacterium]|nr:Crp/Fnr family transcriptional regulator [Bacteroidota bacterium]
MIQDLNCSSCNIRPITLFSNISDEDIDELNNNKVCRVIKKGQTIFYEGMQPTGLYCLNSGKIKIFKHGISGKEQIVRFVLAGGPLGVRALMGGRNYSASATTLEDSVVCYINKKTFFKMSIKYPEISQSLMTLLSSLLEEAESKMTTMAQKPVRERLAESLLILYDLYKTEGKCNTINNGSVIMLSRVDLANIVGTATETVIRLLSEFKDEQLISISGRKITLLDIEGIKNAAKLFQ